MKTHASSSKTNTDFNLPLISGQVEVDSIKVKVCFNSLLRKYAQAYSQQLVWNAIRISDTEEERIKTNMYKYMTTIIAIRCNTTCKSDSNNPTLPKWLKGKRFFAIPPFLNLLVQHIGYVYESSVGIELTPEFVSHDEFLEQEEFELIERFIRSVPGSDYASEFPSSKRGDWTTMSICVINEQVKSTTHNVPGVNAVIGAFLGLSGLESVLNPRVTYGSLNFFETFVEKLASFRGVNV